MKLRVKLNYVFENITIAVGHKLVDWYNAIAMSRYTINDHLDFDKKPIIPGELYVNELGIWRCIDSTTLSGNAMKLIWTHCPSTKLFIKVGGIGTFVTMKGFKRIDLIQLCTMWRDFTSVIQDYANK